MGFKNLKFPLKTQRGWPLILPKKHHFAAKTNQNSRFIGCEAHILDRLHIMVLYIRFYKLKKSYFGSKSKEIFTVGFSEKW
jgi:hypothetical protein